LWVAPVVLIGVVAGGLAGRVAPPARVAPSAAPVAEASSPLEPVGTAQLAQRPTHRQREEGTDGLMGSLPFGIAGDTPTLAATAQTDSRSTTRFTSRRPSARHHPGSAATPH
jgi:hypothetical protein